MNKSYDLILESAFENERKDLEEIIDHGILYIQEICKKYSWEKYSVKPFFTKVYIFHDKKEFDTFLKKVTGTPEEVVLPDTYCGGLLNDELILMSPEYYWKVYADGQEDGYYKKLIAHEMAHELHVRLLDREEEKMGPVWFYEGFATYISDQFVNNHLNLSKDDMKKVVLDSNRGSYKKYNYIFKHFIKYSDIYDMLKMASEDSINNWAINKLEK